MLDLGPHAGFILASYAIFFCILFVLIIWIKMDRRKLENSLEELAKQGFSRGKNKTSANS